jgi:nitrogen fixation protein FixH
LLSIDLSDAQGKPLAGARVEVDAFANARAANIEHAVLDEAAAGRYQTTLKSQRPGLWEVRIRATGTGGEHYVDTQRIDLVGGPK